MRRLVALALVALGVVYLWQTSQIPLDPWSQDEPFTSRTLPYVYGALLVILGGIVSFRTEPIPALRDQGRTIVLLLSVVAFAWLLGLVGLWWSLGLLLLTCLLVMGERRPWIVAGVSAAIPLVGWLLIERLLGLQLAGIG